MKSGIIFILLILLWSTYALPQTWTVTVVDTGTLQGPVMQIDSKDFIHITYNYPLDSPPSNRLLRYALWNKTNWTYYNLDTVGWVSPHMTVTETGYPCIEYSRKLKCFNGVTWSTWTFPDTVGSCGAIAFDNSDTLNALAISTCTNSKKVLYWLKLINSVWTVDKILDVSCSPLDTYNPITCEHSIFFDNQNYPWILYVLGDSLVVISHWDGYDWSADTVDHVHMAPLSNVISTDFVLDKDDKPHLVYECGDSMFYAYQDGIGWNKMLLCGLDATALTICMNPLTNRAVVSLAPKRFGSWIGDSLFLAYHHDGFIWHYELIDTTVYNPDNYGKIMDFDSAGKPTMAYLKLRDGNTFFVCCAIRSEPVAVKDEEIRQNKARGYSLFQNYPNPFNQSTKIEFTLSQSGFVSLTIYDLLGRKIRTLVSENLSSGYKSVLWDGKDDSGKEVSSGIYFYQLKIGDFSEGKKLVLLK